MNVFVVVGSFEVGGAERTALELVRCLQGEGGYRFTVVACRGTGPLEAAFAETGAAVPGCLGRSSRDPGGILQAARLVHRGRTDVVMIVDPLRNGLVWGLLGSLAGGRGVKRVLWCHAPPGGEIGRYAGRVAFWRKVGLLDAIICVSRSQRRELLDRPAMRGGGRSCRRRMPVIPNGIDVSRFRPARANAGSDSPDAHPPGDAPPPGIRTIVQVANLQPWKDHDTLLRAVALLRGRDDVRLVLAGRGTDTPPMRRRVRQLGLTGRVALVGERQDVPELLAGADIGVLSTRTETFGVAILEYLAAGCAVVATDLPALRELVRPGVEALLTPRGDARTLAAAIGRLLDDDALRIRLVQAGRRRAHRFSAARMAGRFDRLFRCLVRGERGLPARS